MYNNFGIKSLSMLQNHFEDSQSTQSVSIISINFSDDEKTQKISRCGHWNKKQTLMHYLFLYHHKDKFQSKVLRKTLSVFRLMSKFIKTRTSSQCRTHHQKVMEKHLTISASLNHYMKKNYKFFDHYNEIKSSLDLLEDFDFCGTKYIKSQGQKSRQEQTPDKKGLEKVKEMTEIQKSSDSQIESISLSEHDKDLMICHQLFLKWMNKLNYLMKSSQSSY